ncbi:TDP-N-acetylfucosamine:lipid II N-acetylfucosaminyltransferase [Gracilimonas sediminicola]|uniref:TDP-N-acetylfucosamine:lipid II N-acetylfucosaminyltransferase n=1 Tax=Gracilimonas sediminicola TaxID=2952158 RepID=A0A9X2L5Z3_9BACT|nr:TDP-N-acetylfucosamine:lipid II N-acetylfucosaminyltransferase [Gracilimonas sediminicola]
MKAELEKVRLLLDRAQPDADEAIKVLNLLAEQGNEHWLIDHFLGIAHMVRASYEKAVVYFETSLIKHAENPHAYLQIAKCFNALSDFEQAERYGKAAIQLDQHLLEAWMFMGEIYQGRSDLEKAIQCFTIANKLDPKNHVIAYKLAGIYSEKGDLKKAMELYDIALHMQPNFEVARAEKDKLYTSFGRKSKPRGGKYIHLCFNHLYAKSLSDMLAFVNEEYDQQHLLFVESHWAIEEYKPDLSSNEHAAWFNHEYDFPAIINRCLDSDVDALFVHGLFFKWQKKLIKEIGSKKHIGWIIWGGDLYNPIKIKEPVVDIVKHIDSIHSLVEGDVEVFKKHYGDRPTFRFGYPYPGLYGDIPEVIESKGRPRIIVGNSGDYSNNHIEILEALRTKKDVRYYDILLPVSYNLLPEYEVAIHKWLKAAGMLGLVKLIKTFIEPDKYRALVDASEMLITAHNRQQAIGNMLLSLYSGNTTVLKKKITVGEKEQMNPTWEMLKKYGLGVSGFEEFRKAPSIRSFLKKAQPQKTRNQQIIMNEFGLETRAKDLVTSCRTIRERVTKKHAMVN